LRQDDISATTSQFFSLDDKPKMSSHTDDSIVNEEEDEDEDDPFSMAVKELSETNRQADEIARVSIYFKDLSSI
jgi:hypothetical protein